MQKEDFARGVVNDINEIRVNPSSVVKRFQVLKTGMTRFKGSQAMVKELELFINFLSKAPGVEPLQVSYGLNQAAQSQVDIFEANKAFDNKVDQEELEQRCKRFVKGFTHIYQAADDGGDVPTDVVNRLVNSKSDVEKVNRKFLLDTTLKYIGVAHKKIKDDNVVVIIVADHVEDVVTMPTVEGFMTLLNSIRTRPIEHINTFDILQKTYKNKKTLAAEANYMSDFLTSIVKKPLHALQSIDIMRDLAQLVMENISNINSEEDLKNLARASFSGFQELAFYTRSGETNGEKILTDMLLDRTSRRNLLENKGMKIIGVIFNDKIENAPPMTVVVIADHIEEGPERSFDEKMVEEINKLRDDQSNAIKYLTEYKANLKKFFAGSKKNFIIELDGLIAELTRDRKHLPNIILNEGLTLAAKEYFDHLEQADVKVFYPQDDEYLKIALSHYISAYSLCEEYVQTGGIRTENVIIDLLVSENDLERKSRRALLNADLVYAGIYHGVIRGKRVTIVIFTDKAEPLEPKLFSDGFLEEINNMRRHPKSYVKYIQKVIDDAIYPEEVKTKIQKDSYMQDLYGLRAFLQTTRTFGPFAENTDLIYAADTRLKEFMEIGGVRQASDESLRAFLSDFGSEFNNVAQIEDAGATSPRDLLIALLSNDPERKYRNIIFSKNLNFIGIAKSSEVEKEDDEGNKITIPDPNMFVVIFADKFEPLKENLQISILNHRRRLNRPTFTDDEVLQIHKDFKAFDVLNTGLIKPEIVLMFMDSTVGYSEKNPIYYDAIKALCTDENNANGVDVEEFVNAVHNVIRVYHQEERWYEIFGLYHEGSKKKVIDFDILKNVATQLGYRLSDEELQETLEKLADNGLIDGDKFTEIVNIVENQNAN